MMASWGMLATDHQIKRAFLPVQDETAVKRSICNPAFPNKVPNVSSGCQKHRTERNVRARQRGKPCQAASVEAEIDNGESQSTSGISCKEERRPKSNLLLSFTVPAAKCKKAWERAVKALSKDLEIPGFRPGKKIPEGVVIQQVGRDAIIGEALSRVMDLCFTLITDKYKEQAFGESIAIDAPAELLKQFNKDKDFSFQANIDMHPTLSWSADYTELKVDVPEVGNEETDQEAAKERIWQALKQKGSLRVVEGRGLEKGDLAIIDFEARRADTGEAIAGSEKKGMQVDTMDDNAIFAIEGIVSALNGKVPGEKVRGTFNITDTWWEEDGAQPSALDCSVDIKEVFTWDVPELTDELAKELLPGCQGVDDLWSQMIEAQRMLSRADLAQNVNYALTEAVASIVDCDVPEFLVKSSGQNEYQRKLLELQSLGKLDAAAVEQLATEEMLDNFIDKHRDELEHNVKGILGIEAIFNEQKFTVPEEEIRKEAEIALQEAKMANQELDEEKLMTQIYEVLKGSKVLEYLTEVSEINIVHQATPLEIEGNVQ